MRNSLTRASRSLALCLVVGSAGTPALAADGPDAKVEELERKLDQSIRQIDALSARVRELEAAVSGAKSAALPAQVPAGAAPAAAADGTGSLAQKIDTVDQRVTAIESADAARHTEDTGLAIHGFADVDTGNYNPYYANLKGTSIGSLDFYLAPRLGGQVVSLTELIFETGPTGEVGTDLERMQIGYEVSDEATLWVGRFHTPYGYVNTALHHGVWLADALRRPKFLNFEDHAGVMPAHAVGAWLTGAHAGDSGKLFYDFYVGNGQEIENGIVDMQSAGNEHAAQMAGSRLGYQWNQGPVDGLTVGIDGFTDRISNDQTTHLTRMDMLGAYAAYDTDRWEHIVEAYSFHDTNLNGGPAGVHRSDAWFVQLAYRAHWGLPYIRYERASLDQRDRYFAELQFGASYYRSALGIRFDINTRSSVKLEVAGTHTTDYRPGDLSYGLPEDYNEVLGQYAIRF
jgi:hypothetical protein